MDAGLVVVTRSGRKRWNHLNPVPLQELYRRWVEPLDASASDALLRVRDLAERDTGRKENDMPVAKTPEFRTLVGVREVQINADPERVWKALTEETSAWWHRDFYTGTTPRAFRIELELGGRVYEDWGDGQGAVWWTVKALERNRLLTLSGEVDHNCGGPSSNICSFELVAQDGGTRLRLTETIFGVIGDATAQSLEDGWRLLLEECLKPWVEEGRLAPRPDSVVEG